MRHIHPHIYHIHTVFTHTIAHAILHTPQTSQTIDYICIIEIPHIDHTYTHHTNTTYTHTTTKGKNTEKVVPGGSGVRQHSRMQQG